jgi:hypothetical protein
MINAMINAIIDATPFGAPVAQILAGAHAMRVI